MPSRRLPAAALRRAEAASPAISSAAVRAAEARSPAKASANARESPPIGAYEATGRKHVEEASSRSTSCLPATSARDAAGQRVSSAPCRASNARKRAPPR